MVYVTFDAVFHFFFKNIALDFVSRVSLKVYRSEKEIDQIPWMLKIAYPY